MTKNYSFYIPNLKNTKGFKRLPLAHKKLVWMLNNKFKNKKVGTTMHISDTVMHIPNKETGAIGKFSSK